MRLLVLLNRPAAFGAAAAVVTGVPLALLLPRVTHASSEPGATASAVDTGFFTLLGGGIGVAIGAAIAAFLTDRGTDRRFQQGLVAAYLAAAVAGTPFVLVGERLAIIPSIAALVLAAIGLTPFVLLGALLGTAAAGKRR